MGRTVSTADWIDEESRIIQTLHSRMQHFFCIPAEQQLPRGRFMHVNGGGGHVDMVVTYDYLDHHGADGTTVIEAKLQSDRSTQCVRLPEGATNVKIQFIDRAGKRVQKVDRTAAKQPAWIKNSIDTTTTSTTTQVIGRQASPSPVAIAEQKNGSASSMVEEFCIGNANGVDVVFCVKGV